MEPFFTIVIPCYNRKAFIMAPIDSCLLQDFTDFEILVVDDGSTDGTVPHLKKRYKDEKRIRYIQVDNGERGRARNIGHKEALGKYVIFIDSDDMFNEGAFRDFNSALAKDESILFLCGKYNLDDGSKKLESPLAEINPGKYDRALFLKGNPVACNLVVKRDCAPYQPFREQRHLSSMEDWIYLLENLSFHQLHLIPEYTVTMNDHDQRSMRSDHTKVIKARLDAMDFIRSTIELSTHELRVLVSYSHYFCGIHAYLGTMRKIGLQHILCSLKNGGPLKELFILTIKTFLGRRIILSLSRSRS